MADRPKRPVEVMSKTIVVSRDTISALQPHADARGVSVNALCRTLLGVVADDDLVAALLDD